MIERTPRNRPERRLQAGLRHSTPEI